MCERLTETFCEAAGSVIVIDFDLVSAVEGAWGDASDIWFLCFSLFSCLRSSSETEVTEAGRLLTSNPLVLLGR